jgi:long-subunit acyl-CoA synthetase (AMP-forming)
LQTGDPDLGNRKELWMQGRHIMMGYINREDANKKVRGYKVHRVRVQRSNI